MKECRWIGKEGLWENTGKDHCFFEKLLFSGYIHALVLFYIQNIKLSNIRSCYYGPEIKIQPIKLVAQLEFSVFLFKKG